MNARRPLTAMLGFAVAACAAAARHEVLPASSMSAVTPAIVLASAVVKPASGDYAGLLTCAGPAPSADDERRYVEASGRDLFGKAQCTRCHAATGVADEPPRGRSCSGCHVWVAETRYDAAARADRKQRFPLWDRYVDDVDSFLAVPDLTASGSRLDPDWIARYLRAPYKVRPGIQEEMIRTNLSEDDARAIATWLVSLRPPLSGIAAKAAAIPPSSRAKDIADGESLFAAKGCATCHAFGARKASPGLPAAPDLAVTRDRMRPADVAAFIADPTAFGGKTTMPDHQLSPREAARLRDFVMGAPFDAAAIAAEPADLPLLERPVTWNEVSDRVFGKICVHCHMNAKNNAGEGGPGNTGGLGYAGVSLDLETWKGAAAGAVVGGKRESVLTAKKGAEPPLIARLRERYLEHAKELAGRDSVAAGGSPGMPLGVAPLTAEDFQLVRSWVAQGAPGPDGRLAIARSLLARSSIAKSKSASKPLARRDLKCD
jgi:mono/diheme cytochrome c family protein